MPLQDIHEGITKILMTIKSQHTFATTTKCICGYEAKTPTDWDRHIAQAQAVAVIMFMQED